MSLFEDPEFRGALEALEAGAPGRRPSRPDRFRARALLVPLGEALGEGDPEAAAALERVRALLSGDREGWRRAIDEEIELAVTEHVRSCDPAWLGHPRYDFAYTVDARARLEARFRAAAALGVDPAPRLRAQTEQADRTLAPFLARHRDSSPRGG